MDTLTQTMSSWTTEEILGELVSRTGSDGPALQLLETAFIRARLAASDRRAGGAVQAEAAPVLKPSGVWGTTEMDLEEAVDGYKPFAIAGHEVPPGTTGAHAHDHSHRRLASTKFAAHEHGHVHYGDAEADARLNGHTHAAAHSRLPWESRDPA